MKRFEYYFLYIPMNRDVDRYDFSSFSDVRFTDEVDSLGSEGWELVNAIKTGQYIEGKKMLLFVFKRPVTNSDW